MLEQASALQLSSSVQFRPVRVHAQALNSLSAWQHSVVQLGQQHAMAFIACYTTHW